MNADDIKKAVAEGMKETLDAVYVERKKHHEDHLFIGAVRKGLGKARGGALITLGGMSVGGIFWAIKSWISSLSNGGGP